MSAHPIITGTGLVTPLGRSVSDTWQSLLAGRFITTHTRLETRDAKIPRVVSLAIEAAEEAIAQAGWPTDTDDTAVIACTSKGSVESWLSPPAALSDNESAGRQNISFGLADQSTLIARRFGFNDGPRLTLSAACAGGLHGLIRAAMMIHNGEASRVLVVAAEASVHPLFLASFQRLGVLTPPGQPCRPFDVHRNGFVMSDAAAAVCVEASSDRTRPGQITIDRFALGGDATHLTGSDPTGRVLKHLLSTVIAGEPIDLVHAHGTGTISNDQTELTAIELALLPVQDTANLYSQKGALGHSLGASGLVSVVLNCKAHQAATIPPNINTTAPVQTTLKICKDVCKRAIQRSLIQAAGFGGSMAVVKLSGNA